MNSIPLGHFAAFGVALILSSSNIATATKRSRWMLPAEFEPTSHLIVTWPHDLALAEFVGDVVASASMTTPVVVALNARDDENAVATYLEDLGADVESVRFVTADHDSVWVRDFGPLSVRTPSGRALVDFRYLGESSDDSIGSKLGLESRTNIELPYEFEGGNLLSNGAGTCLTAAERISPGFRRSLARKLGCRQLISLPALEGEETGHVDMFAAFASTKHVLVGTYDSDPVNAPRLDRASRILERRGFKVTRVPMPANDDGVFRTYLNLALVNGLVLVPVYPDATELEEQALEIIGKAYPGRSVVAIDATAAIELGGAIHCTTMTVAR